MDAGCSYKFISADRANTVDVFSYNYFLIKNLIQLRLPHFFDINHSSQL